MMSAFADRVEFPDSVDLFEDLGGVGTFLPGGAVLFGGGRGEIDGEGDLRIARDLCERVWQIWSGRP